MKSEIKNCQNCKKDFTIEPEDFNFYEKIKVPPPTFCPECRRLRRWVWRNERTYYKRKCNVPEHTEDIISLYSPDSNFTVYDQKYWWSDQWDILSYGLDYDFSKPFFEQYSELLKKVPLIALSNTQSVNSDYCSSAAWTKDCYLLSAGGWNEKVSYSNRTIKNKDSLDLYAVDNSELCYDSLYCRKCYRIFYSYMCEGCDDSMFLYNCRNCQNCFGCSNLRGQNYYFFNQKLSKEEYQNKINELNLGSYKVVEKLKEKFYRDVYLKTIHKYSDQVNSINSTGDHLKNTKNCFACFDFGGDNNENCKYVDLSGFNAKDLYDTGPGAGWGSNFLYEGLDINDSSNVIGGVVCYDSTNCFYSCNIQGSNNIFGCYGLHSKQYCILNKQYTKEEYEELVPKIIKQMNDLPYIDKKGRTYKYGEFFPSELSPFCYNETVAQEYFPLKREQAISKGYNWKDKEERKYNLDIKTLNIPDDIKNVSEEVIGKVIECEHDGKCSEQCTEAFKITEPEFNFYKKMNLPLPRLCPNCRHYQRLQKRNPLQLWHRKCMNEDCKNEFETSYAPECPEKIYCESCYNKEIY